MNYTSVIYQGQSLPVFLLTLIIPTCRKLYHFNSVTLEIGKLKQRKKYGLSIEEVRPAITLFQLG